MALKAEGPVFDFDGLSADDDTNFDSAESHQNVGKSPQVDGVIDSKIDQIFSSMNSLVAGNPQVKQALTVSYNRNK